MSAELLQWRDFSATVRYRGRHPGAYEQIGGFGLSASGNLREGHHSGPLPEMPRVFRTPALCA